MNVPNAIEINGCASIIICIFVSIPLGTIPHRRTLRSHIHNLQHATGTAPITNQISLVIPPAKHAQKFDRSPLLLPAAGAPPAHSPLHASVGRQVRALGLLPDRRQVAFVLHRAISLQSHLGLGASPNGPSVVGIAPRQCGETILGTERRAASQQPDVIVAHGGRGGGMGGCRAVHAVGIVHAAAAGGIAHGSGIESGIPHNAPWSNQHAGIGGTQSVIGIGI
mmetsp:Transcript_24250/g.51430  ORF Transcript_24250/g.51430 Transcript_24250/m.51430 type:complete len:223 (+) Transcript_24250:1168-1836(+)